MVEPAQSSGFNDPLSPLISGPVEDKLHGHKQVDASNQEKLYTPIPEEQFERPKVNFGAPPPSSGVPNSGGQVNSPNAEPPLTDAEKKQRAEESVKMALRFYEDLHKAAGWLIKPNEKKITKRIVDGELDGQREIQLGLKTTDRYNLGGIIVEVNDRVDETLVVSDKFKKEITPPLTRIAMKQGWGVSDEFTCLEIVGRDVVVKGAMLYGIYQSMQQIIGLLTIEKKEGDTSLEGQVGSPRQPSSPPPPPKTPSSPNREDVPEIEVEPFDGHNANREPEQNPYPNSAMNEERMRNGGEQADSGNVIIIPKAPEAPKREQSVDPGTNPYYKKKTDRVYKKRK